MSFPLERVSAVKILVIGDVMLDRYWFGEVDRISPEAPVPVVKVARREDRLGGAANVARNIVALGAKASLMGLVGDDEAGRRVAELAREEGIQTRLVVDETMPTTLKMRVMGRQQQLLRVDFEELPADGGLASLMHDVQGILSSYDVVVLSDYAKGCLARVEDLIAACRRAAVPVLVDPKGHDYTRYTGATIITPNRLEMSQAVGAWKDEADLEARAQTLRERLQLEALLITRSEQGMTLFTEAGRHHIDAQAHEVFDVSGAGDTVLATLAVARAAGLDWQESVYWANRAGGIVVGKLGTSVVTAGELS
ncbi:MAG TPA: D-glycero-beta-D-manno-heptose-7-phosphate kinase [Burkholderiaceae bacterium]|nr:D-glycero-beta-D-manno-heptose-7-phosphate kinase [Burkholderiaceae bacterium]